MTETEPLMSFRCRYREASVEVMKVMSRFAVIERASIDEAYMDLTSAVQERLKKMSGQPILAKLLPTTYIQGMPIVSTTAAKKECVDRTGNAKPLGRCSFLFLELSSFFLLFILVLFSFSSQESEVKMKLSYAAVRVKGKGKWRPRSVGKP